MNGTFVDNDRLEDEQKISITENNTLRMSQSLQLKPTILYDHDNKIEACYFSRINNFQRKKHVLLTASMGIISSGGNVGLLFINTKGVTSIICLKQIIAMRSASLTFHSILIVLPRKLLTTIN